MGYDVRIVATGFTFPESPRWHAQRAAFYHVDIDEGELFELKDGVSRLLHKFDDVISGLSFDDTDGFYVASVFHRKVLHLAHALDGDAAVTDYVDLADRFAVGMNDMTRGPRGELYVGGFNFNAAQRFQDPTVPLLPGTFLQISPDRDIRDIPGSVTFPNGIVFTPEGDRVLMADTYDNCVYAWSVGSDGTLGERSVWADLGEELPDGMCMDAEGALWIASHNRVLRVHEGGAVTDDIPFDDGHVTACTLGGADGCTLLITAAASIDRRILHASRTGVIYEARVDVPGAGQPSLYA